jgi:pantoate--beta-alanine ligase
MQVFVDPHSMRAWSVARRADHETLALVPTMGALHLGHMALIDAARRRASRVVVSIFVNPLQFNSQGDFDRYPRPIDADLELCRTARVDAVYAPVAATIYPPDFQTRVVPGTLASTLEGPSRPGHFEGVTTVVLKLLNATVPDVAVFGTKDYQQLAVVRKMVSDLDLGVVIDGVPTIRQADGLALSSRNVRLSATERAAAVVLSRALTEAVDAFESGTTDAAALRRLVVDRIEAEPLARLEYVEVVDTETLEPLRVVDTSAVVLVAAWLGEVRLIDNAVLIRRASAASADR